jgi:hypothetical protein
MATRELYFLGVSGDWTATANWALTRGGAGGELAPDADDNVYVLDGAIDITTNLTGVTALTIKVGGDFQGNIGAAGTALTVSTTSCVITVETVGRQFVNLGASTTVATVNVNSTGQQGRVTLATGTFTDVNCGASGRVDVGGSCVVTNLYSAGIQIVADYSGTAFTVLELDGGSGHEIRRAVTTARLTNAQAQSYGAIAITTLTAHRGTRFTHGSNGTITTANARPGSVLLAGFVPFIVTNSTLWESGSLFANSNQVTYTNPTATKGRVGRS